MRLAQPTFHRQLFFKENNGIYLFLSIFFTCVCRFFLFFLLKWNGPYLLYLKAFYPSFLLLTMTTQLSLISILLFFFSHGTNFIRSERPSIFFFFLFQKVKSIIKTLRGHKGDYKGDLLPKINEKRLKFRQHLRKLLSFNWQRYQLAYFHPLL